MGIGVGKASDDTDVNPGLTPEGVLVSVMPEVTVTEAGRHTSSSPVSEVRLHEARESRKEIR